MAAGKTRSVFDRCNVTSERDLADALERGSRYIATRAAKPPKVRPHPGGADQGPAQNPHNRGVDEVAADDAESLTAGNAEWRRAESNRGPRDYETLALAY